MSPHDFEPPYPDLLGTVAKVLAGLLVGAILGLVISIVAGWFSFSITC